MQYIELITLNLPIRFIYWPEEGCARRLPGKCSTIESVVWDLNLETGTFNCTLIA